MLGASAAVGGSILAVGKSTADYAGDMYDMARGAGIGVEAFQKLAYAGRMSGVETEKLSASLVKFDRMVAEATVSKSKTVRVISASRTRFSRM